MDEKQTLIQLHWVDWAVVFLYILLMFGIAYWAMKKIKDPGGFFLAKRKMGPLMTMFYSLAQGTSANHPMAVAASTFERGLSGAWLSLTWILITPFYWMFPPVARRLRVVTGIDIVEHRFGKPLGFIYQFFFVFLAPIGIGFGVKSAAIVVEVMTGGAISGNMALIAIIVPTIIYTLMGGIIAAAATDVLQGFLIIVLSFLLIPFAIHYAGGIDALDAGIAENLTHLIAKESGQGFGFWWIFWFAIGIFFAAGVFIVGEPAKNEMTARLKVFGTIFKRFCTVGWAFVGLFGIALFTGHPALQGEPDGIFALASGELLPVVLRGVMVASILAAVMSTLDQQTIVLSANVVNNIYSPYVKKKASAKHYLLVARIIAATMLILGTIVGFYVDSLVRWATIVEPIAGLIGMLILAGICWRRATWIGCIAALAVMAPLYLIGNLELTNGVENLPLGVGHVIIWMQGIYASIGHNIVLGAGEGAFLPVELKNPLYIIPGLVTIIVVSLLTKYHDEEKVKEFFFRLDTPVGQEHKLVEAGYITDDLEHLDNERMEIAPEDHDVSKRFLLPDIFRFIPLIIKGEAKWSDYKVDLIGLGVSIVFVILFIQGVEWLGSFF